MCLRACHFLCICSLALNGCFVNLFSKKDVLIFYWIVIVLVCNLHTIVHFLEKRETFSIWDRCIQLELNERMNYIMFVVIPLHISYLMWFAKVYIVPFIRYTMGQSFSSTSMLA
jgi:hypothetical protein